MRTDKKTRDLLRFLPKNHTHHGDYCTNWGTGLRYIAPSNILRVSEGGMVFLTNCMDRDPDTRKHIESTYGICVIRHDELPTLYAPGTARKITKRSLPTACMYLHDVGHNRVLDLNRGLIVLGFTSYAVWTNIASPARTHGPVKTIERNLKREKEWMAENADLLLRAKAVYTLEANRGASDAHCIQQVLDASALKLRVDARDFLYYLGSLMETPAGAEKLLVPLTADRAEYPHLCTVPNGL